MRRAARRSPRGLIDHLLAVLGWLVPCLVALAIAFGIGTASARAVLGERGDVGFGRAGAWRLDPSGGGAEVDPYTRARLARTGAVPLGLAEGLSLTAIEDDAGRPLDANCRYAIVGPMPPARRWSLWVEPGINDPARPFALHDGAVVRDRGGRFTIEASRGVRPGNWLALPTASAVEPTSSEATLAGATSTEAPRSPFTLRLALYDTPAARTGGAGGLAAPPIRRLACATLPNPIAGTAS